MSNDLVDTPFGILRVNLKRIVGTLETDFEEATLVPASEQNSQPQLRAKSA